MRRKAGIDGAKLATAIILLGAALLSPGVLNSALGQQPNSPSAPDDGTAQRIVCEHAAPPRGSHWVCDKPDRPCDCHLESNVSGRPIFGEGEPIPVSPGATHAAADSVCQNVSVEKFVAPHYPHAARLGKIQGKVTLYATLAADGRVLSVVPKGPSALTKSAAAVLKMWTFRKPPEVNEITVVFNYVLREKSMALDTPATDVTANFPCEVEISTIPPPPVNLPRIQRAQPPPPQNH